MRRRWCAVSWVLALVGCAADEAREPAELAELCGVDGPVQLVAFAPGEALWDGLRRFGDRYVYRTYQTGETSARPVLWSIGLCGEAPLRLAEGLEAPFLLLDVWPDVPLACSEERREIVTIDPTGALPPHVVFTDIDCRFWFTTHGLVSSGGEPGDDSQPLQLHPYPDDPRRETAAPSILVDRVPTSTLSRSKLIVRGDAIFLLDQDSALLRVDLADGTVTVEQTDVLLFSLSSDARYLLWQDLRSTNAYAQLPEGAVFLRDRTTGVGASLLQTSLHYGDGPFRFGDAGHVELMLPNSVRRLYTLPGLAFVDLPLGVRAVTRIADGRWLLEFGQGQQYALGDVQDVAAAVPLAASGPLAGYQPDGILTQDVPRCCADEGFQLDRAPVWFIPFDGSPPRRLSDAVSRAFRRVDERSMLAVVDVDEQSRGELVLIDVETRRERSIDREVVVNFFTAVQALDERTYVYRVDDGERSGVWAVRLPPA